MQAVRRAIAVADEIAADAIGNLQDKYGGSSTSTGMHAGGKEQFGGPPRLESGAYSTGRMQGFGSNGATHRPEPAEPERERGYAGRRDYGASHGRGDPYQRPDPRARREEEEWRQRQREEEERARVASSRGYAVPGPTKPREGQGRARPPEPSQYGGSGRMQGFGSGDAPRPPREPKIESGPPFLRGRGSYSSGRMQGFGSDGRAPRPDPAGQVGRTAYPSRHGQPDPPPPRGRSYDRDEAAVRAANERFGRNNNSRSTSSSNDDYYGGENAARMMSKSRGSPGGY
ncbi:hypothetical protein EMIHUDRAFT_121549, partial [Emiliania huxleyi CCMP1516]|uniref:Uncharacterized protein n=2 Tax=Emiliania huxleyi TaxID=2903 RepID=A0A0D3I0L9_EMIH1